jgi:biopolymer transport protein TolR
MSTAFRRHRKRKLKSEINVVPYIDVMLVLLIIFMVTAPLLSLGVDVELPRSDAKAIESKDKPIVVQVHADGTYTLRLTEDGGSHKVDAAQLSAQVGAVVASNPQVAVFVAGDHEASYTTVYEAMAILQLAGVGKVGLISQPANGR